MAFDGISTACIVLELENAIQGGRIDKITQPERDEINITIRNKGKNHKLLISANTSGPRIHLTKEHKESPERAPMFCMLLRKHIAGGKIVGIIQPDFERVVKLQVESYNELGDLSIKTLVAEIMGKHSNIILTDSDDKILGSIKHVDFTVSSVRQLLTGMKYEMPPSQGKLNPLCITEHELLPIVNISTQQCDKFILELFTGISPLNAREIAFRAVGDFEKSISILSQDEKRLLTSSIIKVFEAIKESRFCPVLLYREESKPWDFNAMEIFQYSDGIKTKKTNTLSESLDEFSRCRYNAQRMSQKSHSLLKFVNNNISRCRKKIELLKQTIEKSGKREQYKILGDLLTANLHNISGNMTHYVAENYYDNMKEIEIPLLLELSPAKNAQRYYNLYQKAKNAEEMSKKQLKGAESELIYLESVHDSIVRAENENDINEL